MFCRVEMIFGNLKNKLNQRKIINKNCTNQFKI